MIVNTLPAKVNVVKVSVSFHSSSETISTPFTISSVLPGAAYALMNDTRVLVINLEPINVSNSSSVMLMICVISSE